MTIRLEKGISGVDPRDAMLQAIADMAGITADVRDGRMRITREDVVALEAAGVLRTPFPDPWKSSDRFELSVGQTPYEQTVYLRDVPWYEGEPRGTQLKLNL